MNTSLVPSLQHIACCRLIVSLFNDLEVHKNLAEQNYETIKCQVKDALTRLTPCTRVQEKLEVFVDPLLQEVENCVDFIDKIGHCCKIIFFDVKKIIPRCWLSEGTIDLEKLARFVVENEDFGPGNRFIFACTFGFSEALDLWNILFKIEKVYLKLKSNEIVKLWIEWYENSSVKDWESFLAFSLGTPLGYSSVSFLKHALQTLSPADRSRYLLNTLIINEAGDDIMRFCISVLAKDEQEQIFKKSIVRVFSCMLSWPLRTVFLDRTDNLWPYLTEVSFRKVLEMILRKIRNRKTNSIEFQIIIENFWAGSPEHLQNAAKDDLLLVWFAKNIWNDVSRCSLNRESPKTFWEVYLNEYVVRMGMPESAKELEFFEIVLSNNTRITGE